MQAAPLRRRQRAQQVRQLGGLPQARKEGRRCGQLLCRACEGAQDLQRE